MDSGGTKTFKRDGVGVTAPVLSYGVSDFTPGISTRTGGATKFSHDDRLGTLGLETDSSQATTATKQYDAFGMPISSTGSSASPFGFAGRHGYQEDLDSGLKLLGHRYYDPSTGRFLTRDPIKDGRNWYGYCGNNPLKFVDPDGLKKLVIVVGDPNDNEWANGADLVDDGLAEEYAAKFRALGWYVVIVHYYDPDSKIISEVGTADGLVFIGRGKKRSGRIRKAPGQKGQKGKNMVGGLWFSPEFVAFCRDRAGLKGWPYEFIVLEACGCMVDAKDRHDWLELATVVAGYQLTTDTWTRYWNFGNPSGEVPKVWGGGARTPPGYKWY